LGAFVIFVLGGMGKVILHHDVYEERKQAEWNVFYEYAIPPESEELSDESFNRFKTVVIIKKYRVRLTKEELIKAYREKLESAGWQRVEKENDKVLAYVRDDMRIDIVFRIPKVEVWVTYDGKDQGI
jgi:hypothetical protein